MSDYPTISVTKFDHLFKEIAAVLASSMIPAYPFDLQVMCEVIFPSQVNI